MSIQEEEELSRQQSAGEPGAQEVLTLLAAVPWLLQQYFADSVSLLKTESRLALRSLMIVAALTLCLAGLIAGAWLVLIILAAYGAAEAGVPSWGIAIAVILLHILVFAGLLQQTRALARYLLFPNSRRALLALISRDHRPSSE